MEGESAEIKSILFEKIGIQLGMDFKWHEDRLDAALKQWNVPQDYLPSIYRGVVQAVTSLEVPLEEELQHATAFCGTIAAFKKNCYEGIGLLNTELEKDFIPDYFKGLGERAFYENHPDLHLLKPFIKGLKDSDRYQQLQMMEYFQEWSS